jgi:hypothetical protein
MPLRTAYDGGPVSLRRCFRKAALMASRRLCQGLQARCLVGLVLALGPNGMAGVVPQPGPVAGRALAGDGPEELAAEALKQFGKALGDKDVKLIEEALQDFDRIYGKVGPKTVKKLHKAYGKLFKLEPREEFREDGSDPRGELLFAYQLAVGSVFDKPGGDDVLQAALKQGHVKRWPEARALFVEGLGQRVEADNIRLIAGYLEDDSVMVVRAAAGCLGLFSEADVKVRREAVAPLIKVLGSLDSAAKKEAKKGKREDAQEFLLGVEGSFLDALLPLTRQRFDSAADWAIWFKQNGSGEDW